MTEQDYMDGSKTSQGKAIQMVFPEMSEDIDLDEYEIVSPQFFAQLKEPAFTVNVDKITVNAACVRMMPDVDYVEILINRREKKLVLRPCSEMEISGYRWARTKSGKRYSSQRTGEPFVLTLCQIMDWNPDFRYKILGKKDRSKGQEIIVFDLMAAQCFPKAAPGEKGKSARRSAIPIGWDGKFGPTVGENRRSLHVDTFDGYTVFSIDGKKQGQQTFAAETSDTDMSEAAKEQVVKVQEDDALLS